MMNTYRSKSLMQLNVLDTSEYPLYRHLTRPYRWKWAEEVNFQGQVLAQSVTSPNQAAVPL